MLALTVIQGPDQGKKFQLPTHEPQLIGRSSEALPLTDSTVSRRHAELTPDGNVWYIRDLASQNGTWVNGVEIKNRIKLQLGDQIRVGSTVFVFGQARADDPAVVKIVRDSEIESDIEHRLSSEDSMVLSEPEPRQAAIDHLRVIYQLTTLTTRLTDKTELLRAVLELVFDRFKPERGVVLLAGPTERSEMIPGAVKYRETPASDEARQIRVSRTILKAAFEDDAGVLSSNAMTDPRFKSGDSVQEIGIRSAVCSPIIFQDQNFGAIYIDSSMANYTFTREQLALLNAIGRHTGLALAHIDQTEREVQSERLAAVGETVASLSHSIKNILQGLRGGTDVVEIGLKKDDLQIVGEGWGILKRNIDRIVGLTMNMLAFGRPKTLELESVKVGALVEDSAQLFEAACAEKGIALIVDADPEIPPIHVDPGLLHQALTNLIANAVEAVEPQNGVVTARVLFHEPEEAPLATAHPGEAPWVEIRVIDNGTGIPQDRLSWIFEPFHSTKGLRGTGLGLAVTRRIVAEHRGRIRVETKVGSGSTFRVFIPADLDTQIDPSATARERAAGHSDVMGGL
ncbi:MAG: two-component system NtrC family sensor kinase [Phycisphaerales bacterium]|jgi:two-component system NtrC family sensor kinase